MRVVAAAAGMPSVGLSRGQPFFAHVLPRVAAQALKGQKAKGRDTHLRRDQSQQQSV